ncbi:Uncharacterised protein [uncultured archaeon]|nr:Uncharacterised protein [uncultured archaeon]
MTSRSVDGLNASNLRWSTPLLFLLALAVLLMTSPIGLPGGLFTSPMGVPTGAGPTPAGLGQQGGGYFSQIGGMCDQNCPTVTIGCSRTADVASCVAASCSVCMKQSECDLLRITPGSYPSSTLRAMKCQTGDSFDKCKANCQLAHEVGHSCFPHTGGWPNPIDYPVACQEPLAEVPEKVCVADMANVFCSGTTPTRNMNCNRACSEAVFFGYTKTIDSCACKATLAAQKAGRRFTASDCCGCYKECLTNGPQGVPSVCVTTDPLQGGLNPTRDNSCSMYLQDNGISTHSCDYFGGPHNFDPSQPATCFTCPAGYEKGPFVSSNKLTTEPNPIKGFCNKKGFGKGISLFSYPTYTNAGGATTYVYCCNDCPPDHPEGPFGFAAPCMDSNAVAATVAPQAIKKCETLVGNNSKGIIRNQTLATCSFCGHKDPVCTNCAWGLCSDQKGGMKICCTEG